MYQKKTNDITVSVESVFLEHESSPANNEYFWAYHIEIKNEGKESVQLDERYWQITDSQGHMQEVRGEGVVGQKPVLKPGDIYKYTSGAPLHTPWGIMVGKYYMKSLDGATFAVDIPAFSLDSPHQKAVRH